MSSFVAVGLAIPGEKMFKGFLPYMYMAAILVMRPGLLTNTLVPTSYRCFLLNLTLIGQAVLGEK